MRWLGDQWSCLTEVPRDTGQLQRYVRTSPPPIAHQVCRAPTFITPADQPVNFVLASVIPKLYPEAYRARVEEHRQEEREVPVMHIPLFVYEGVPWPGQPCELTFFEHR